MTRAGEREGDKGARAFFAGWRHQPGQKAPVPPAGPASHWTRDKSHILSRAQRLPGQMAWNKGLFCSSVSIDRSARNELDDETYEQLTLSVREKNQR